MEEGKKDWTGWIVFGIILFLSIIILLMPPPSNVSNKENLCIYKIPDNVQFLCQNKTINNFDLDIFTYNNAINGYNCTYSENQENRRNSSHYEIYLCNSGLPFNYSNLPFEFSFKDKDD